MRPSLPPPPKSRCPRRPQPLRASPSRYSPRAGLPRQDRAEHHRYLRPLLLPLLVPQQPSTLPRGSPVAAEGGVAPRARARVVRARLAPPSQSLSPSPVADGREPQPPLDSHTIGPRRGHRRAVASHALSVTTLVITVWVFWLLFWFAHVFSKIQGCPDASEVSTVAADQC